MIECRTIAGTPSSLDATKPFVSCILATANRRRFIPQALRCFLGQTYADTELIIVDDGEDPVGDLVPDSGRIRYLNVSPGTSLGTKLNIATDLARGPLIQKLDDDDYYHPAFIARMAAAASGLDPPRSMAALDCFLVLVAKSGHLAFSGHGWFAGNSLCFHKTLWERQGFREIDSAEDWFFVQDHKPYKTRVCDPHLSIVIRHGDGHTWSTTGSWDVTDYFSQRLPYSIGIDALMSETDCEFYRQFKTGEWARSA